MPHSDPEKRKEMRARRYRERLIEEPWRKAEEAARKAAWLQTEAGVGKNTAASARWRASRKDPDDGARQ